MTDEPSVECPQCGHINEPAAKKCANCSVYLKLALERGSQYWTEAATTRPPLILLSDDEIGLVTLYSIMLEREGYRVARTLDPFVTIELAERLYPDLIITDFMKPGMNGAEMISRLKSNPVLRDIPVIVVSAGYDYLRISAAMEAGAIYYLSKPILQSDVITLVESVLSGEPLPLALIQVSWKIQRRFIVPGGVHSAMCRFINCSGFRVWPFWYREDSIRLARLFKPAVIAIAFHLPESDGLDLLSRFKADSQVGDIPVVMWGDDPAPELEQQAMQCGAQAVYTGPPDGAALAEVFRSVLGEI